MTSKMSAQDKRFAMIKRIMEYYVNDEGVRLVSDTPENRAELVAAIRLLAQAGRTDRWQSAVSKWAAMVENTDNELDWAMLQGQIFAGYGAM